MARSFPERGPTAVTLLAARIHTLGILGTAGRASGLMDAPRGAPCGWKRGGGRSSFDVETKTMTGRDES